MAVKLRLTRVGKTKQPHYRVVATDSRSPRDGRFIQIVGTYNPRTKPAQVELNKERVQHWLGKGARPSDSVRTLLAKYVTKDLTPAPAVVTETPAAQ